MESRMTWKQLLLCRTGAKKNTVSTNVFFDGETVGKLSAGFCPGNFGIRNVVVSEMST